MGFVATKKVTTMSCRLLLWLCCNEDEENNNFCHLHQWLCYKKMATCAFFWWFCYVEGDGNYVVAFLYGVWVVKKATGASIFFFLLMV
jgi:hypothetical protein